MKKMFALLTLTILMAMMSVSAIALPCSSGYAACVEAGGGHTACNAGFEACLDVLYPS